MSYQPIAIAIIHGIGSQEPDFADRMKKELLNNFQRKVRKRVSGKIPNLHTQLEFGTIYWDLLIRNNQERFLQTMGLQLDPLNKRIRKETVSAVGDLFSYLRNQDFQKRVYSLFAKCLEDLTQSAGQKAPLCIISHSLGSVIAHNYFLKLQYQSPNTYEYNCRLAPLEHGKTLMLFYTLGSPLALLESSESDYPDGTINVPPAHFHEYYPNIEGEWINFYAKGDNIAFPLQGMGMSYRLATKDREVKIGGSIITKIPLLSLLLSNFPILAHINYWTSREVIECIANSLANRWIAVNQEIIERLN